MVERGEKQHPQPPKGLGAELWYPFDKQRGALITNIMLKWTNPTTYVICCPNWWCFPGKLYHFPLMEIHEWESTKIQKL